MPQESQIIQQIIQQLFLLFERPLGTKLFQILEGIHFGVQDGQRGKMGHNLSYLNIILSDAFRVAVAVVKKDHAKLVIFNFEAYSQNAANALLAQKIVE